MTCCYPDSCGEYAVTPVLVSSKCHGHCCGELPLCYPCLPCTPKKIYCCEKKSSNSSKQERERCLDCEPRYCRDRSPPRYRRPRSRSRSRSPPPPHRRRHHDDYQEPCCYPASKPVKTKYVIPCYRYEDGRINQPTVLMRRACEVAVGSRMRRKPFVEQSYTADEFNEVRRYASEDERGNCCFHYEKKNNKSDTTCCGASPPCPQCNTYHNPCMPCSATGKTMLCSHQTVSSPQCCQYMDCVATVPINSRGGSCCYYC